MSAAVKVRQTVFKSWLVYASDGSADAIYLLPGWRDSDLAQAQARVAELRGMRRFGVTA